jgi:protein-disulfide isomerase
MQRLHVLGRLAIVSVAVLLASCGVNTLPQLTASVTTDTSAAGAAYPSIGAVTPDSMPAPFSDPSATTSGGREVIKNPTIADVMAPSPLPEMSWGRPDAPVTIVQYASLTCPHCRNFHKVTYPELKRRFIDTGKVRYILREFPIGKTSGNATIALRCAPPDKYLELYGKFMEQQPQWVSLEVRPDAIFAVAQQVGMTRAQFDACLQNQGMIEKLKWVKDRGRKLGIVGTPNFFIGNKLIKKELTIADIAAYVEEGEQHSAPTAAANP